MKDARLYKCRRTMKERVHEYHKSRPLTREEIDRLYRWDVADYIGCVYAIAFWSFMGYGIYVIFFR